MSTPFSRDRPWNVAYARCSFVVFWPAIWDKNIPPPPPPPNVWRKKSKQKLSSTGLQGLIEHVRKINQDVSSKQGLDFRRLKTSSFGMRSGRHAHAPGNLGASCCCNRSVGLNWHTTCIWYVEVWKLKLYFYPSAGRFKKKAKSACL